MTRMYSHSIFRQVRSANTLNLSYKWLKLCYGLSNPVAPLETQLKRVTRRRLAVLTQTAELLNIEQQLLDGTGALVHEMRACHEELKRRNLEEWYKTHKYSDEVLGVIRTWKQQKR